MSEFYTSVFEAFRDELEKSGEELFLYPLPFTLINRLSMLAATIAQRHIEWILVEDRLPAPGQKVLRYGLDKDDHYDVGELVNDSGHRWADWGVTHWAPLLDPP